MAPTDAPGDRRPDDRRPDDEASTAADDPTAVAEDGMAPLITNTGVDDADGDAADASTG